MWGKNKTEQAGIEILQELVTHLASIDETLKTTAAKIDEIYDFYKPKQ